MPLADTEKPTGAPVTAVVETGAATMEGAMASVVTPRTVATLGVAPPSLTTRTS